jgi:uncharacterized SAM-binding protein YcdF (DUF218 family)
LDRGRPGLPVCESGAGETPALRADAIVVLGCRVEADGQPCRQLRRRVEFGIEAYRKGVAPLLVLSGGGRGPIPEAAVMREVALRAQVPEAALLCEAESRDTAENALHTARLLRGRGHGRVVLVSDRAHLLRARLLFRLAGLTVVAGAPVPPSSRLAGLASVLRNLAAMPISLLAVLTRR